MKADWLIWLLGGMLLATVLWLALFGVPSDSPTVSAPTSASDTHASYTAPPSEGSRWSVTSFSPETHST